MTTHPLKLNRPIVTLGILLGAASLGHATIIGFATSNTTNNVSVTGSQASWSFATADVTGLTVSNGATPNIALTFANFIEYHHGPNFDVIENFTSGGAFDSIGTDPDIAQLDGRTIDFTVSANFALVLNSFDFGLSRETATQGNTWTISLARMVELNVPVWSQTVTLSNVATGGLGDVRKISPAFTGLLGESYRLNFNLDSELGGTNLGGGRNAIDNLSFNQIPEPSAAGLVGLAGLALLARRRK